MIPFSAPRIDDKIIAEVTDTLRSRWIGTGPKTKLFEQRLAEYTHAPKVLCVNSATAGLELMLRWFGVGPGDEVIVPAYTFAATANVVIHCGATPVFVDVADDFNIKVSKIAEAVTEHTKAIIPVDFAGFPVKYAELKETVENCRNFFRPKNERQQQLGRMLILSDSAHALGATYKGHILGTQADAMVFSFHATKNLTTAEGGAIMLNLPTPFDNLAIYQNLCIKGLHGQTRDAYAKQQQNNWKYDIVEAGYKYNLPDLGAAIGLIELERYNSDTLPKRKAIFEYYTQRLKEYPWAQLHQVKSADAETSYHLFPLRIHGITEQQRDAIIQHMYAAGVAANVHFMPVPGLTYYKNLGYDIAQYPTAYDNFSREISLPVFYDLTAEQMETVVKVLINSVEAILS